MRRLICACAALVPLMVSACASGGGGGTRAPVRPVAMPPAAIGVAPALAAAAYVAAAASIDLFEIQSAQLAMERSRDSANRAFAQRSLRAHEGTSAQLSMAGRRLNLLPSSTLSPEHQQMINALQAAPDFDRAYRQQQTATLRQGIALHGSYARRGTSPTLRPVAKNAEVVMRRNQEALRR